MGLVSELSKKAVDRQMGGPKILPYPQARQFDRAQILLNQKLTQGSTLDVMAGFSQETRHETHVSTFSGSPQAHPRLSGPDEDPRWPCGHSCTPRQRPQAPGRLIPDSCAKGA